MRTKLFSTYHSSVIFLYFCSAIIFTMLSLNPYLALASFLSASVYYITLKGIKSYLKTAIWYVGLIVIIASVNGYCNGFGITLLFKIGSHPITLEALIYGIVSGTILVTVMLWFSCYSCVMTNDKFLALFSRVLPTVSMMTSMVLKYIPDMLRQGRALQDAKIGLTGKKHASVKSAVNDTSLLMSIGLESSIETCNSMLGRGYGVKRRTSYTNERFKSRDFVLLVVLVCFILFNIYIYITKTSKTYFYPLVELPDISFGYLFFVGMLIIPLVLEGKEYLLCKLYQ